MAVDPYQKSTPLQGIRDDSQTGLRSKVFDRWFILGIPAIALSSLAVVLVWPATLFTVLLLDVWLLGFHHVIATYTRIGMDRESLARHWMLLGLLPVAVMIAVFAIGMAGGATALTTIYFYWLWFHYVRQSEGISKAYAARGGARDVPDMPLHRLSFYLVPTASLLQVASTGDNILLNIPIKTIGLSAPAMALIWTITGLVASASLYKLHALRREGKLSAHYVRFVYAHYAIFVITYGLVDNLTAAWLGLNVWHNLQYLTFVWLSHQGRFKGKIDSNAMILSTMAKPKNILLYLAGCLTITFAFYSGVSALVLPIGAGLGTSVVLTTAIMYQTINFHHYIVDAVIWRRPKKIAATRLGHDATSP